MVGARDPSDAVAQEALQHGARRPEAAKRGQVLPAQQGNQLFFRELFRTLREGYRVRDYKQYWGTLERRGICVHRVEDLVYSPDIAWLAALRVGLSGILCKAIWIADGSILTERKTPWQYAKRFWMN